MTTVQHDETWDEHYTDEKDAAWLYRQLAGADNYGVDQVRRDSGVGARSLFQSGLCETSASRDR